MTAAFHMLHPHLVRAAPHVLHPHLVRSAFHMHDTHAHMHFPCKTPVHMQNPRLVRASLSQCYAAAVPRPREICFPVKLTYKQPSRVLKNSSRPNGVFKEVLTWCSQVRRCVELKSGFHRHDFHLTIGLVSLNSTSIRVSRSSPQGQTYSGATFKLHRTACSSMVPQNCPDCLYCDSQSSHLK